MNKTFSLITIRQYEVDSIAIAYLPTHSNLYRFAFDRCNLLCYIRYKICAHFAATQFFGLHIFIQSVWNRSAMPFKHWNEKERICSPQIEKIISKQKKTLFTKSETNLWQKQAKYTGMKTMKNRFLVVWLNSLNNTRRKVSKRWTWRECMQRSTDQWCTELSAAKAMMVFAKITLLKFGEKKKNLKI